MGRRYSHSEAGDRLISAGAKLVGASGLINEIISSKHSKREEEYLFVDGLSECTPLRSSIDAHHARSHLTHLRVPSMMRINAVACCELWKVEMHIATGCLDRLCGAHLTRTAPSPPAA